MTKRHEEKIYLATLAAYRLHGTTRATAKALGVSQSTVDRHIQIAKKIEESRVAARAGELGFDPVLPGFEITKVTSTLKDDKPTGSHSVTQKPEASQADYVVPDGHIVGKITHHVRDGKVVQSWPRTAPGAIDPIALAEALKSHFQDWSPSYSQPTAAPQGNESRLAFYPISDLHIGIFSWKAETGINWDLKIARKSILDVYSELIEQTPATDAAAILFGGDMLHADNYRNQTERSGHHVDMDGRYPKVSLTCCEIGVEIIEMAARKHRKIEVDVIAGNHDDIFAVAMRNFLFGWFRNNENISVSLSPSAFWFRKFGRVMLAATHGHTLKAVDFPGKVAAIRPKMWGECDWRYGHWFHEHHDEIVSKDWRGMKVEKHAIIAPGDAYNAAGPHAAFRNAKSIVYDAARGEKSRSIVGVGFDEIDEAA